MRAALFAVWPMLLAAIAHAIGFNAFSTYSILEVTGLGYPKIVVGLISTSVYAGLLVGSLVAFKLIGSVGHIRVFAASAGLIAASALVGPFLIEPFLWAAVRFVVGIGCAGLVICLESWLNERSTNEIRGQVMALYQIVFYGFAIVGNLLVGIDDKTGFVLMMIVAFIYSIVLLPVTLSKVESPAIPEAKGLSLYRLYNISPLGFIGVFVSGVTLGMMFGAGPLFATLSGLDVEQTTHFMSALIAGALIMIWPVGKLSDLFDRRLVMIGVAVLGVVAGCGMLIIPVFKWEPFLALTVIFGGFLTSLYPLALSYINDRMDKADLSAAATGVMIVYGVGAVLGPTAAAVGMEFFGAVGFIYLIGSTLAALVVFAVWRMTRREGISAEESGDFQALPTSSAVAFDMADPSHHIDEAFEPTWVEAVAEQQEAWRDEASEESEHVA